MSGPARTLYTLCFIRRRGEVLLLRRSKPPNAGRWNAPGGRVEPGEAPWQACRREVLEETGLTVRDPELRAVLTITRPSEQIVIFVYRATAWEEPAREGVAGELGPGDGGVVPAGRARAGLRAEGEVAWRCEAEALADPRLAPHVARFYRRLWVGGPPFEARFDYDARDRLVRWQFAGEPPGGR